MQITISDESVPSLQLEDIIHEEFGPRLQLKVINESHRKQSRSNV